MSVTVGVIGCGGISRFHFSGLKKAGANVKNGYPLDSTSPYLWGLMRSWYGCGPACTACWIRR
jgi:hypothetical protein